MTDLETRAAPEAVKEPAVREAPAEKPASKWRNWYSVRWPVHVECAHCGKGKIAFFKFASRHACCAAYPSMDAAETAAASEYFGGDPGAKAIKSYLGAFPEGQTP